MRVDLQNNRYCRFCPYSSDNLSRNPLSERLARRCADPKTEGDNHVEIIVLDDISFPATYYMLFRPHFAFVQLLCGKYLFDMPFDVGRRNMKNRRDFLGSHPYRSVRRRSNRYAVGFYGNGSSFHNYASNAIFSISPNCPANACMSRPILSLVMRA